MLQKTQDVTKDNLHKLCSDPILEPDLFIEKFIQSFNSMKTDAGNSHGKVFLEDNGFVYIYPQAMSVIEKYFS